MAVSYAQKIKFFFRENLPESGVCKFTEFIVVKLMLSHFNFLNRGILGRFLFPKNSN